MKTNTTLDPTRPARRKNVALYARVSTQEQTKGQYPSCDSQVEELEAFCKSKGWDNFEIVKDEGHRAGTLKRPGLAHLRYLVETEQIDTIVCTWYNRLIGSRDFYVLDKEFKAHNVAFVTVHDPADRHTASGRLLESMLVTIKTFENEQVAEKVRTKMRQRAEKGLWNGGYVPFGFSCDPQTQALKPNDETKTTVLQMFRVYVEKQSDFAVRDWLKAHNVPTHHGKAEWTPSSIRDLLMNRRYIGEVEINKQNKGIEELPEFEEYRIIPMDWEPIVPRELFETAQAIRQTRSRQSPHRGGKGKGQSYSRNQCQRVYLLQGNMVCGVCGAAMSPHYVYHKPNERDQRRTASYIYHYTCAHKMKYRQAVDHSNRVLARVAESWMLDAVEELVLSETVLERALAAAWSKAESGLEPNKAALAECESALRHNEEKIDELLETASNARGALLELFTEKAHGLKLERERLKIEQRNLQASLAPLTRRFDARDIRNVLSDFALIRQQAQPEQLRRLLRTLVKKLEWSPDGQHKVQYYLPLPRENNRNGRDETSGKSNKSPEPAGSRLLYGLADPTGFEPAVSSVTGRRDNRYTTGPFFS